MKSYMHFLGCSGVQLDDFTDEPEEKKGMNIKALQNLIDQLADRKSRIYNDDDAHVYSVIHKEITSELTRLYMLDRREAKLQASISGDILWDKDAPIEIDHDGDPQEWMDVRDTIDTCEIKLSGLCRQFGALHTEGILQSTCRKLQDIAHKAFGMGD